MSYSIPHDLVLFIEDPLAGWLAFVFVPVADEGFAKGFIPIGSMYTTIVELGTQNQNKDLIP